MQNACKSSGNNSLSVIRWLRIRAVTLSGEFPSTSLDPSRNPNAASNIYIHDPRRIHALAELLPSAQVTAEDILRILTEEFIPRYGAPMKIQSDSPRWPPKASLKPWKSVGGYPPPTIRRLRESSGCTGIWSRASERLSATTQRHGVGIFQRC